MSKKRKRIYDRQAKAIEKLTLETLRETFKGDGLNIDSLGKFKRSKRGDSVRLIIEFSLPEHKQRVLEANCRKAGLPDDIIGRQIKVKGQWCEIVDVNPRAYKYPVVVESGIDGKRYKVDSLSVKWQLGIK